MRSKRSRSASSPARSTASRSSGKRSSTSSGASRTDSWLPRRSGSEPSSDVHSRIATSTSCSCARRAWCACTSPVATVCTPSVSARSRSAAFRRTSPRSYGRWSSTKKRSRNAPATAAAVFGSRTASPCRAQPERQTSPSFSWRRSSTDSAGSSGGSSGLGLVPACAEVEKPAEVRVAARVLDEQRDVSAALERHLRPGDRPHAERLRRVRELERAEDPVVVGEGERLVAELGRAQRELLGQRGAVQEGIGRVRVELDVRHRRRRGRSDRTLPGVFCVEGEQMSPTNEEHPCPCS